MKVRFEDLTPEQQEIVREIERITGPITNEEADEMEQVWMDEIETTLTELARAWIEEKNKPIIEGTHPAL